MHVRVIVAARASNANSPLQEQIAFRPVCPSPNKFLKHARSWSRVPRNSIPVPSGRVFPELRAPLYRSLTNRGCDTLHQTDGGYFIRRLRLNLIEQIDKNHSVPTNESTNMIEPDQWDGVLGSVTGTIYRGTERVSSSRLSAPRSWMPPGRRLTLSCLAMASGPIETTHQETDTPSATREPRSCGTASPCGANIVSRRKLLLQRQKRQKRPA